MCGNRAYVLQKRQLGHLYPVHLYGGQGGDWQAEGPVGGHNARSPWGKDRVYGYDYSRSVPEIHLYSRQMRGVGVLGLKLYNSDI